MKTEDIIEGLNRYIEEERKRLNINSSGHIVIRKNIIINPTVKAYKTYTCEVYFVKNKDCYKVTETEIVERVISGQEERINRDLNINLMIILCDLLKSDIYEKIINGDILI